MLVTAVGALLGLLTNCLPFAAHAAEKTLPSVADAIQMTRIQYKVTDRGEVAAISPSGKFAAIVAWRGDLARDRNIYELLLVDLGGHEPPRRIFSQEFTNDPIDQLATPISNITFVNDEELGFIAQRLNSPAQVYFADATTGQVRRVTNHPTSIRSYVLDGSGRLRAFSAIGNPDVAAIEERLNADGVFPADRSVYPFSQDGLTGIAPLLSKSILAHREFFLAGRRIPFFDSRDSRPDPNEMVGETDPSTLEYDFVLRDAAQLTGDPAGKWAILFPFARTSDAVRTDRYAYYAGKPKIDRRFAAPYGLVDLQTGRIELLLDAPSPGGAMAVWAPDSRSVVLFTLDPTKLEQPPKWLEVEVKSRRAAALDIPDGWSPVRFLEAGKAILLQKKNEFASIRRSADGAWGQFRALDQSATLNSYWNASSNGTVVVGVADAPDVAPELVSRNFETGAEKTLTGLNPWLRSRQLSLPEELFLNDASGHRSAGFLIMPAAYEAGRRYPLVLLFDDGMLGRTKAPFLFDAAWQLNGHAIQMLSAEGFMVFYLRDPPFDGAVETLAEGQIVVKNLEMVLTELDKKGLVDRGRVGLSGWSRAAYYTHFALIHSNTHFAAASALDGGAREYNDGLRPFTDNELARISTPLLYEAYGIGSLNLWGAMADRMIANGQPIETVFYQSSAHSTVRPQHRRRSLQTHIDWWKFWLMGQENPTALSAAQFPRWREMRTRQCKRLAGKEAPWYCKQ